MTLPNNFSTTKQKLAKIWEQTEANKVQIDFQLQRQQLIVKELNRTAIRTFDNNQIENLDVGFASPIVIDDQQPQNITQALIQKWELSITGLLLEELIALQINMVFRFGSGGTYLDTQLTSFADVFVDKIISVDSTNDSRDVTKKVLIGFYLHQNSGLPEFDDKNMQIGLNVRLPNPRYYN